MTAMSAPEKHTVSRRLFKRLVGGIVLCIESLATLGCTPDSGAVVNNAVSSAAVEVSAADKDIKGEGSATAIFAGGCFWCMEQPFDVLPGVTETTSGYTGGTVEDPTYTQVSNGNTGHVEAMQVTYDPSQVSYDKLLDTFWHNIDPLDNQGQFCDKGSQYRSAIFYDTPGQEELATESKAAFADKFEQPIATDILPASEFYPAEDYHQNYYQTRPVRYKVYRFGCGRDQRLSDVWGADAPNHD